MSYLKGSIVNEILSGGKKIVVISLGKDLTISSMLLSVRLSYSVKANGDIRL